MGFMALSLLSTSCELDINDDPRYPKDASVEMLLPSTITWSTTRLGCEAQLIGSCWSQFYTQENSANQYNSLVTYDITSSNYNGIWNNIYSGALADLKMMIQKGEAEKKWDYYAIGKILMAFDYHILVDLYGTIPFTESLMGDQNTAPKFDDGKVVNAGIIALLDEAIAKAAEAKASASKANPAMGGKDYIYKGDMDNWIGFAKALKVKILMRDYNANKEKIAALIENTNFTTDARVNGFTDKEFGSNPLYESERRKLNTPNNLRASSTVVEFLLVNKDPRIANYFENAPDPNKPDNKNYYKGLPYGNISLQTTESPALSSSRARFAAEDPVYLMSYAEFLFIKAEFYARENNAANAKTNYDLAVKAAFNRWGHDASSFIAAGGAYEFNAADMLKSIMTQKWIAAVRAQGWDAFFDINRTGIPALGTLQTNEVGYEVGQLVPAANSVLPKGELPRRLWLPKSSLDFNTNAPKPITITTKMWWHK